MSTITMSFSRASKRDARSRVTLNDKSIASEAREFLVVVRHNRKNHTIHFYRNRASEQSLKTTSWAQGLPSPAVGRPVTLEVIALRVID